MGCVLAHELRNLGHTVERATEIGLGGATDEAIFGYAQQRGVMVITKDAGFVSAAVLPPDHRGVILLRFPNTIKPADVNRRYCCSLRSKYSLTLCAAVSQFWIPVAEFG